MGDERTTWGLDDLEALQEHWPLEIGERLVPLSDLRIALSRAEAAERVRDSLRLELEGANQARERDNTYLIERRDEAARERDELRERLDRLQEVVCQLGDVVHGTVYRGSHGLQDVLEVWSRIGREFQTDLEAALAAKRTAASPEGATREEQT